MAAGRWMGRGDKIAADQAAVDAMRSTMLTVDMDGIVVIGEGEKDEAPMLYIGEQIGNGQPPPVDIAVDPEVDLCTGSDGYFLKARLNVSLPGLDRQVAQTILDAAHHTCPYSKATRGNIDVAINLMDT